MEAKLSHFYPSHPDRVHFFHNPFGEAVTNLFDKSLDSDLDRALGSEISASSQLGDCLEIVNPASCH